MPAPSLQLTLLNVPSTADGAASLPRPQHVILNHIYMQRGQAVQQVGRRSIWRPGAQEPPHVPRAMAPALSDAASQQSNAS